MQKSLNLFKKNFALTYLLFIILSWVLSYLIIQSDIVTSIIWCGIFIYVLFKSNNKQELIYVILLLPFKYGHRFDITTIPYDLMMNCLIGICSMIIYIYINKIKIYKGKYFYGFLWIGIALILGGLFTNYISFLNFLLITIFVLIAGIAYFLLLSIIRKIDFSYLVNIMYNLGIIIIIQYILYCTFMDVNVLHNITTKQIFLGWGATNNIALILLGIIPFTFYKAMKSNAKNILINTIVLLLQIIFLFLTFSRGSIFIFLIIEVPILVLLSYKIKEKKIFYLMVSSFICLCFITLLIMYFTLNLELEKIIKSILSINLENLNGRNPLFNQTWQYFKEYPVFGIGIFGGFSWNGDGDGYLWAHGTLFHTMLTMGSVGVLALAYHMVEKYFYLFKKLNLQKVIIILALFATDCYGFFDVSYYYPVYMVFLLIILLAAESIIEEKKVLIDFKKLFRRSTNGQKPQ